MGRSHHGARVVNELEKLLSELEAAKIVLDKCFLAYERMIRRPKKKAGRPSLWRADTGRRFVDDVETLRRQHPGKFSLSAAQRIVLTKNYPEIKITGKRSPEQRFQEAREHWYDHLKSKGLGFSKHDLAKFAYEDALRHFDETLARARAALNDAKAALND